MSDSHHVYLTASYVPQACPANRFTSDGIICSDCPRGSISSAGSSSVLACKCPTGQYPVFPPAAAGAGGGTGAAANGTAGAAFTCADCPAGALCDATVSVQPLALDSFWHRLPFLMSFYECKSGYCLSEPNANLSAWSNVSNCRTGHSGAPKEPPTPRHVQSFEPLSHRPFCLNRSAADHTLPYF